MTHDDFRRNELSDFLRTRRARISPADIGIPAAHRRRTPGLRREEVAQLAGMSATWYTWLEQRRPISVSSGMLDNLARVLQLNPVERIQLFRLARREPIIDSDAAARNGQPAVPANARSVRHHAVICYGAPMGRARMESGSSCLLPGFRASTTGRTEYGLACLHSPGAALFGRRMVDTGPGHASQVPCRLRPLCRRLAFCPACGPAERRQSGIRPMVAAP